MKKHKDDSRFDFGVEHQPAYAFYDYRSKVMMFIRKNGYKFLSFLQRTLKVKINMDVTKLEFMDYKKLWECVINRKPTDEKRIPGAFTGWDNTPRKGKHGLVVHTELPRKIGSIHPGVGVVEIAQGGSPRERVELLKFIVVVSLHKLEYPVPGRRVLHYVEETHLQQRPLDAEVLLMGFVVFLNLLGSHQRVQPVCDVALLITVFHER